MRLQIITNKWIYKNSYNENHLSLGESRALIKKFKSRTP